MRTYSEIYKTTAEMVSIARTVTAISIPRRCGRQTTRNNVEADHEKQRGGRPRETTWRQITRNNVEADHEKQRGGRPRETTWRQTTRNNVEADHEKQRGGRPRETTWRQTTRNIDLILLSRYPRWFTNHRPEHTFTT